MIGKSLILGFKDINNIFETKINLFKNKLKFSFLYIIHIAQDEMNIFFKGSIKS